MTLTLFRLVVVAFIQAAVSSQAADTTQAQPGSVHSTDISDAGSHKLLNLSLSSAWASKHAAFLATLQNAHYLPLDAKDSLHQVVKGCLIMHGGAQPHVIRQHLWDAIQDAENSTGSHAWDVLADAAIRSSTLVGDVTGAMRLDAEGVITSHTMVDRSKCRVCMAAASSIACCCACVPAFIPSQTLSTASACCCAPLMRMAGGRKVHGMHRALSLRLLATSVIADLRLSGQHMGCR